MNSNNASDSFIKISLRMCTRARALTQKHAKLWVMMWTVSAISVLRINRIEKKKKKSKIKYKRERERDKWRWTMINSIQLLAPIPSNTGEFTWITCDGVCFNLFNRYFHFFFFSFGSKSKVETSIVREKYQQNNNNDKKLPVSCADGDILKYKFQLNENKRQNYLRLFIIIYAR